MSDLTFIVLLTLTAGLAMPLGAAIAAAERIRPLWLETEFLHSVVAFGGGALLSAVALVLVPEGIKHLTIPWIPACFLGGGFLFMLLDRYLATKATAASQLVAMMAEFFPEALALGATFAYSKDAGYLLAAIIALQNLPEGFNAFRELKQSSHFASMKIILMFALMALLGPVAATLGFTLLANNELVISGLMLFAAGGILYLIFQDIAPQAKLKSHWAPPLGAVLGFLLGIMGKVALGV